MEFKWQVKTAGLSAKRFLARQGVSHRMFTQINHSNGKILVNGKVVAPATKLAVNAELTLIMPAEPADPNVPVSHEPLTVIFEDENFLVVAKPAGLTVVPGPSNRTDTLVNRVKGHLVDSQETNLVPHVITRLDWDTSGLVLLAKHRLANSWMNQALADHTLVKRYLALVGGQLPDDHGIIDAPLRRADEGFNQIVAEDGKPAKTEYWVRQRFSGYTLVEVLLHTGRTHQIRAHFQSIGHPLLGDALYGGDQQEMTRQALHAFQLGYDDPMTHVHQQFALPLPEDMQRLIK